jgi:hypothetical protein
MGDMLARNVPHMCTVFDAPVTIEWVDGSHDAHCAACGSDSLGTERTRRLGMSASDVWRDADLLPLRPRRVRDGGHRRADLELEIEPRCDWHATGNLPARVRGFARDRRYAAGLGRPSVVGSGRDPTMDP